MTARLQWMRIWVLTFAALGLVSLTFSLGQWQLRRADQKERLQAVISEKKVLSALDSQALAAINNIATETHRPVLLNGAWMADHTVYLENRAMNGRSGFWVLTPFALQGSNRAVLVQRGWVPRDFNDRTRLPAINTPGGAVTVQGRVAPPPSRLYAFRPPETETGRIRQNLDLQAFRLETGLALLDASVLETAGPKDGLLRDWPAPNVGVEKHYGYAFQWFGLCALTVVLYGWFQVRPALGRLVNPPRSTGPQPSTRDQ